MALGSTTSNVAMINLVMTAADGSGGVWQDPVQLIPLGMGDDPAAFVSKIKAGLPLVNNLRVLFNEHSFNADGSMHPQMEAFLAAAVAQGLQLTICYGEGDAQNIGIGNSRWPSLTNAQAMAALQDNYADMAGAWTRMMDWMDDHAAVRAGVYGWELMNESAGYRHSIRENGAGQGLTATDFVKLYADHAIALSDLIDARAAGRILVGGWGYNGDFISLGNTKFGSVNAIDYLRTGVGADLVWSAHLYPGWMGTSSATSPAALLARLEEVYAHVAGDDVLITEINADGRIDNPAFAANYEDFYAASYDWFAANGIGLGWYPGVQTGASHLLYLETNGTMTFRHQHSLGHALNAFSISRAPVADAAGAVVDATLSTMRLRNEDYEIAKGEATFDAVSKAGFGFGYGGNDTVRGTDLSNDFLYGGTGHDLMGGQAADDFLFGQSGNDQLFGGTGIDNLFGGTGADLLDGGAGNDYLAGGQQNDTYLVNASGDSVIEFAAEGTDLVKTGLAALTLAANVENLVYTGAAQFAGTGNALANILVGGVEADVLRGLGGNDTLAAGAGNDTLFGGTGADVLNGGAGTDAVSYKTATAGISADLALITTGAAAGEAAGDSFVGVEWLVGSDLNDRLWGDQGANYLWGNAGVDILNGRTGNDRLYGGAGADRFVFALNFDTDTVADFQDNIDTIALSGLGLTTPAQALDHATQAGAHVLFDFGNGDRLVIANATKAALADDILILG